MKLPRQPEIVMMAVTCPHDGDCQAAAELVLKSLENYFDHVQCWKANDGNWQIACYPRAVND